MRWSAAPRPSVTDLAIAAALLLAVQLEVWIWWVEAEQGPRPLAAAAGVLMTAPLAWRRLWPLRSFATLLSVHLVWVLVAVPRGSLFPFLVELLGLFTVAELSRTRPSLVALVAAVATEVTFVLRTTNDLADYAFILAFLAGAWGAGRGVRARQERADLLFARTVRLEVEREEQARAAVEEERTRIARELHDIISHSVSVMVVQAGAAEQVMGTDPVAAATSLRAIQAAGRAARLELRQLLGLLRDEGGPTPLEPQPDLGRVGALVDRLGLAGVRIDLHVEGHEFQLPPGIGVSAYRIIQEALTNVVKHSDEARATVTIRYLSDQVELEVFNPAGTHSAGHPNGYGLVGMRERVALCGGELEAGTRPDGGYTIRARLPAHRGTP